MSKSGRTLRIVAGLVAGTATAAGIAIEVIKPVAAQSVHGRQAIQARSKGAGAMTTHSFVGMWVTADGYIRHELLPNGRYDEARGAKQSAYRGRYAVTGNHIDYVDDTGFAADGEFIDGVLYHAGMILRRKKSLASRRAFQRRLGVPLGGGRQRASQRSDRDP